MDWRSGEDARLIGAEADAVRDRAAVALMVDAWPADTVRGELLACGSVAWLAVTDGGLSALAIAPRGSRFEAGNVACGEFFAEPWPATWRTKRSVRGAQPATWSAFEVGGFACGMLPDKRAVLAKVAEVDAGGQLLAVVTVDGAPSVPVTSHKAVRWFGLTKWPAGLARLWAEGRTVADNYPFLTILAGKAERLAQPGTASKPGTTSKPSKRGTTSKPGTVSKPARHKSQ